MACMHFRIAATPVGAPAPDIQLRHEALVQLETSRHGEPESVVGEALAARFRELYPNATNAAALSASSEASLHLRLADARTATFYRPDANAVWKPADAHEALIALLRDNRLLPDEPGTTPAAASSPQGAASSSR